MLSPRTVYLLFCLSGLASLVLQVVWTRLLLRVTGATTISAACVLSAFMAGLALGAYLAGRKWLSSFPLRSWAIAETICAAFAASMPWLFADQRVMILASMLPENVNDLASGIVRFLFAFLILLIPSTAMGAGYPLLMQHFRNLPHRAAVASNLYASNIVGAVAGAAAAGFFMLPLTGLANASLLACLLYLSISTVIFAASTDKQPPSTARQDSPLQEYESRPTQYPQQSLADLRIMVATNAAVVIMLELAWTRIFSGIFGSSVYSVSTVLLLSLLGLSLGALVISNSKSWKPTLSSLLLCSGTVVVISAYLTGSIPDALMIATQKLDSSGSAGSAAFVILRFIVAMPVILPAAVLCGMIFPTAVRSAPGYSGRLYVGSCLGGAIGAIVGAAVLIQFSGAAGGNSLCLLVCASGVLLCSLPTLFSINFSRTGKCATRGKCNILLIRDIALSGALILLLINAPPRQDQQAISSGLCYYDTSALRKTDGSSQPCLFYLEGVNSTVSITTAGNTISLRTNGKVEATLPLDPTLIAPGCDIATHTLLGALPAIFHPQPRKALVIGYGSGITSDVLSSFGLLEHLTVAELEPAVIKAGEFLARFRHHFWRNRPQNEPRFKLNDGRYILLSSRESWDIVCCQAAEPRTSAAADLYTREFWQLVRSRLNDDGICSQWLPLYAMTSDEMIMVINTFQSVFPHSWVCHSPGAGEVILLGMKSIKPITEEVVTDRIKVSSRNAAFLSYSALGSCADLLALFKLGPSGLEAVRGHSRLNCSDSTVLEFSSGAHMAIESRLLQTNVEQLSSLMLQEAREDKRTFPFLPQAREPRFLSATALSLSLLNDEKILGVKGDRTLASILISRALEKDNCPEISWRAQLIERCTAPGWISATKDAGAGPTAATSAAAATSANTGSSAFTSMCTGARRKPLTASDHLALAQALFVADREQQQIEHHIRMAEQESSLVPDCLLLKGWLSLSNEQPQRAHENFSRTLLTRPNWAPALFGRAFSSIELGLSADEDLSWLLKIDPWNATAQFLMTELLIPRDIHAAAKHAVNYALLTDRGDALLLLHQRRDLFPAQKIMQLLQRYAPHDPALPTIMEICQEPSGDEKLARFAENRVSRPMVSGYNKLGFPW